MTTYKIPDRTLIGHVHLKVADLQQSLDFYCGILGFEITTMYGSEAAFISAGGYHHHIGLNTWYSKNSPPRGKKRSRFISYGHFISDKKRPCYYSGTTVKAELPIDRGIGSWSFRSIIFGRPGR